MKTGLANTIHDMGSGGNHMANECERFGMTWGCRPDCPVYDRGECELQQENTETFIKQGLIEQGDTE